MTSAQYLSDLLVRRYTTVALHAEKQLTAAARAQDRADILERASREMATVDACRRVLAACNLSETSHA